MEAQRNYICEFKGCKKSFVRGGNLIRHMRKCQYSQPQAECSAIGVNTSQGYTEADNASLSLPENPTASTQIIRPEQTSQVFKCPNPYCEKTYPDYKSFMKHHRSDDHRFIKTTPHPVTNTTPHADPNTTRQTMPINYKCEVKGCTKEFKNKVLIVDIFLITLKRGFFYICFCNYVCISM